MKHLDSEGKCSLRRSCLLVDISRSVVAYRARRRRPRSPCIDNRAGFSYHRFISELMRAGAILLFPHHRVLADTGVVGAVEYPGRPNCAGSGRVFLAVTAICGAYSLLSWWDQ